MIDVKREDYPELNFKGVIPAHYKCIYRYNGRKIAFYNSREDCLYLNSDYIDRRKDGARDRSGATYTRAMNCKLAEAYEELFAMLGVDEKTHLSEFFEF